MTSPLRAWQQAALDSLQSWAGGPFLISAAPGAGKTRPALELARRRLQAREVSRVAVLCPTTPLTRQWAAAGERAGLHLVPDARSARPPSDFQGFAVTYARIAGDPARWASGVSSRTLVIADEAHHLGEDLAWGQSFARAFRASSRWLLLSGTPFRSDATPIPGVRYDASGYAEPDVSYDYAEAVRDGVCRPVGFITYDGTLSWRSGEDTIESSFEQVRSGREASRRYRTAISTELPDGLARIIGEAHAKLSELRAAEHPGAGGLVVAADGAHARRLAKLLHERTGRSPVVVLHSDAQAARKLALFARGSEPWIVAVNMVSEGVDIPRLRVGVYATAAKTPLIFRQIVGRFVRTMPGRPATPSWLYLPADPVLRGHASAIESELRQALQRREPGEELEQREARPASQPSEQAAFVPLSADVAPQMTLFGGPAPAPSPSIPLRQHEPQLPSIHERRSALREERHRLVADVRRAGGGTHQEINAWLNRALGLRSVEEATLDQLEQSVELLVGRLTKRPRALR
ncbi:MAG: DEAD/DEAH box helicase [Solirubrobacteraceae bacterium]